MYPEALNEKVKYLRQKADLTVAEWSKLIHVSQRTITAHEAGERKPSLDYIYRVFRLFYESFSDDDFRKYQFADELIRWLVGMDSVLKDDALLVVGTLDLKPICKSLLFDKVAFDKRYVGGAITYIRKQIFDVTCSDMIRRREGRVLRNLRNYETARFKQGWEPIAEYCLLSACPGLAFRSIMGLEEPAVFIDRITRPSYAVETILRRLFLNK